MRAAVPRDLAVAVLLVLALSWPALYNGQGIFFWDTLYYERAADAGMMGLLHLPPHSSFRKGSAAIGFPARPPQSGVVSSSANERTVLLERSPFYGALLYTGDLVGGFWLTVLLQAASAVTALVLLLDALRVPRGYLVPVGIALALLSSLPFYVSFFMPDMFTAIVIAGSAVLLTGGVNLSRWQLGAWWLLLAAGALFHDTNLLILCTLLVAAALVRFLRGTGAPTSGLIAILLAIMVGVLGELAFIGGATRWFGVPPMHPPYLTARLIGDGTGVRYLRATCPANGFQVCSFIDRFPMSADDFLWQEHAGAGAFATTSAKAKQRVSDEQTALILAVLAYDPTGQLAASLRNAARQFVSIGLEEFAYDPEEKSQFNARLPGDLLPSLHASAAYQDHMPRAVWDRILIWTFYGSLCFIGTTLMWRRTRTSLPPALISVTAWILSGVLVNAFYCGALSGPHDRYASRVQWLLPLTAMLILARLLMRRERIATLPVDQTLTRGAR